MRYFTTMVMVVFVLGLLSCEKKAEEKEPVASFSVTPDIGPFTTVFIYNATETQNEGEPDDNLQIRWDWDGDGIFDTEYSANKIRSHKYEEAGDYNVRMEVMNSLGWTDSEFFPITVYPDSVAPVASFEISQDTCTVMSIFHFNSGTSWDAYNSVDELRFRWNFDGDNTWDTPFCHDTCVYYNFPEPGNYRVQMQVRNQINMTDTVSRYISVAE